MKSCARCSPRATASNTILAFRAASLPSVTLHWLPWALKARMCAYLSCPPQSRRQSLFLMRMVKAALRTRRWMWLRRLARLRATTSLRSRLRLNMRGKNPSSICLCLLKTIAVLETGKRRLRIPRAHLRAPLVPRKANTTNPLTASMSRPTISIWVTMRPKARAA